MSVYDIYATVRLLYIEDDTGMTKLINKYLSETKHTKFIVEHQCNLNDSLNYLKSNKNKIDIILLDLMLPNSRGVTTYEKVAKASDDIPIVIISAFEDIAIECVKRGAQDYIAKPIFGLDTITKSLRYALERSRLTKEKLIAEKQFRRVVNSTPLGIHGYVLKEDGELIFNSYNPSADKLLKIDHKKYLGKNITEAFPSLVFTDIPNIYKKIAKEGGYYCDIIEYQDKVISKSYFKINAFQTEKNKMSVIFEDITQQILSERKYKNLVEATNAGIFEVDYRTRSFTYVNHVFCKMIGYDRDEIMKMQATDILTENSLNKWFERLEALRRGEFIDKTYEYEGITKDKKTKNFLCTFEYIEDQTGVVIGANAVVLDITEHKRAEEEFKKKEEFLFNELDNRIHQWRNELSLKPHNLIHTGVEI